MLRPLLPFASAVCAFLVLSPLPRCAAALIAYEPFDYPAGTTDPGAGAAAEGMPLRDGGTGFTAPKLTASRQGLSVTSPGLQYDSSGNLAVRGNAALLPEGDSAIYQIYKSQDGDPFAQLRNPERPRALGKPGTVLWLSFLMSFTGELDNQSVAALKIGQNNISIGVCNNEKSDAPYFRLSGPRSNVPAEAGKTYLVVVKITYGEDAAPDSRSDKVEAWINPDLGGESPPVKPDAVLDHTRAMLSDFWTGAKLGGKATAMFDEFRIGETYGDVAPTALK